MSAFDERKNAFETRFVHDAELEFRVMARGHRRLGLWAAGVMGHTGDAAERYAQDLLATAIGHDGASAIHEKLGRDLAGRVEPSAVRARAEALLAEAARELRAG